MTLKTRPGTGLLGATKPLRNLKQPDNVNGCNGKCSNGKRCCQDV